MNWNRVNREARDRRHTWNKALEHKYRGNYKMYGSDKQCKWASAIKREKLIEVMNYCKRSTLDPASNEYRLMLDCWASLRSEEDAKWWIDRRELTARMLMVHRFNKVGESYLVLK